MAKVLLGAGIVEVTGKIGGTVFQRGKAGTIMRRKVSPRKGARNIFYKAAGLNYNSHQRALQSFTYFNREWRKLTPDQRNSWNEKATGKDTGLSLFVHRNMRAGGLTVAFPSFEPIPIRRSIIVDAGTYWFPAQSAYVISVSLSVTFPSQRVVNIYVGKPHSEGRKKSDTFTLSRSIAVVGVINVEFLFPTGTDPGFMGAIDAEIALIDQQATYIFDRQPALYRGEFSFA